jgi:photosystem II stability/assembly factor-like uncharacterized protein
MLRIDRKIPLVAAAAVAAVALPLAGPAQAAPAAASRPQGAAASQSHVNLTWRLTPTGTEARLRGLSAVDRRVAWVSGSGGTVLRTVDAGRSWTSVGPPGTEALQFRDIEAWDARTAVILSIGTGEDSRVYRTSNGGRTWTETFRNTDPNAFYDCMAFWDRRNGIALSDPVDGKFRIIRTWNGGRSWHVVNPAGMPPALAGEFAFAASGTCIEAVGQRHVWFATGGGAQARVFRSHDGGRTWSVSATPVASSEAGGIFSLAFRDRRHGVAVGGDFTDPTGSTDTAAYTTDGGRTWHPARDMPGGYRSGADWWFGPVALAVGPTGSDVTFDAGRTWRLFDTGSFDAVDCERGVCWASGEQGRVGRLVIGRSPAAAGAAGLLRGPPRPAAGGPYRERS